MLLKQVQVDVRASKFDEIASTWIGENTRKMKVFRSKPQNLIFAKVSKPLGTG